MFQFHSGSIQTRSSLLDVSDDFLVSIPLWFDSNTVRPNGQPSCADVSIPLWFDSNEAKHSTEIKDGISFNSTLVRFKPALGRISDGRSKGFNSTLVRFKPAIMTLKAPSATVSIPLWFDSNRDRDCRHHWRLPVSIPLWFDSNMMDFRITFLSSLVSIPLWFDSNRGLHAAQTCTRDVSIPLWFDSNVKDFRQHLTILPVSIPLWFDSNIIGLPKSRVSPMFQFHSGSIQTAYADMKEWRLETFQFHSGSIQTPKVWISAIAIPCFNSTLVRFKLGRHRRES